MDKKNDKQKKAIPEVDENDFPGDEAYTKTEDYIRACTDAMDVLDQYDYALMPPEYKERAETMRLKIFDILEYSVNELYQELEFVLPEDHQQEDQ